VGNKLVPIGMYDTAEEATLVYNKKSLELLGTDGKMGIHQYSDKKVKFRY